MSRKRAWTAEEIQFLRDTACTMSTEETAARLGRSNSSVESKMREMKISRRSPKLPRRRKWEDEEIAYLKLSHNVKTPKEIAKHLNRTQKSVMLKAARLGITEDISYTEKEIELILKYHKIVTLDVLAKRVGRSRNGIQNFLTKRGLTGEYHIWTSEQDEELKRDYLKHSIEYFAEKFGTTYAAVKARAHKLGVADKHVKWTSEMFQYLRENHRKITNQEIADHLGLTKKQIERQVYWIGLVKERG